jgi:hypothetical protein
MGNINFKYLYRDAGNYKKWGAVVFSNPECLTTSEVTKALGENFLVDGLFVAHQVHVPEVFFSTEADVTGDDHCYHEFDAVEESSSAPTDKRDRSIGEFIAEVAREAQRGWESFDPSDFRIHH